MDWSPGDALGQKYQLIRLLGAGSAGSVWEGENTWVGRRVALKVLHSSLAHHAEIRARFLAEARASARIANPHVVDVFDLGETEDGTPFMVMELCEGETLGSILEARGAVGVGYACEILMQVCSALEAAHALGIVHRDLKPANVMVIHPTPEAPFAKVLDFGIATGVHQGGEDPEERDVWGTVHYIAPEQAAGDAVDHRADIYAAGAILYELLAGRPPFEGSMSSLVLADVLTRSPEPLSRFAPGLPVGVEELVHRALAKDPEDRPHSARSLRAALSSFVGQPPEREARAASHRASQTEPPLPLVAKSKRPALELVSDSTAPPPPTKMAVPPSAPGRRIDPAPSSERRPPPLPRRR